MLARRLALALLLAATLLPSALRDRLETPRSRRPCIDEGRGTPPRHWLGCRGDPGPARSLAPDERLVLGLPLDPNTAGERDLAHVPGLSRRLAAEVVAERTRDGPFRTLDDLLRVRGIGPRRLEQARSSLAIDPVR